MSEMSSLSEVLPGRFPPEPPSGRRRRGEARTQRKRKRRKRRRSILTLLLALCIVGGAVAGAYFGLAPLVRQLNEPNDYTGAGTGAVQVKIPGGASGRAIGRVLTDAGVVKTQVAYVQAADADIRSSQVQPGTYQLRKQMSGKAALALLLDPRARLIRTVTIPEGTRAKDVIDLLAKNLGMSKAALTKASTSKAIGLPRAAGGKPEGYLFPATYNFQPDATPTDVLTALLERGQQAYGQLGIPAAQLKTVVIKASIIQAESGRNPAYMGKVSRVLANRLRIKMPLGLDTTISYVTGRFGVTTTPAERRIDSPYNTYMNVGLPAGPISNPGELALKAALNPTPGTWLYFVTVNPDTGETKFADTAAQHEQNRKEFQAWLAKHPQK